MLKKQDNNNISYLLKKASTNGDCLEKEEIVKLLSLENNDDIRELFFIGDKIRKEYVGDDIHLRGIIEFSNYCQRDCQYCGLRKSNAKLTRYRMSFEEIFQIAKKAFELDFRTIVLQSGEDNAYTVEELCALIEKIKKEVDIAITLCVGEKSKEEYKLMKDAGADRYLLKHETANAFLYRKLHPDLVYENRFKCLEWLKELGYQVGSGNMVGLPGQTLDDLAEDILMFKKLDLDMIGIGPFIPHDDTPLKGAKSGMLDLVLKMVALTRIVTKNTHIPATTALGSIDPNGRQKALKVGANVLMPNVGPEEYRQYYQVYPNKICILDNVKKCHACVRMMIKSLDRTVASGFGHSFKKRALK